MNKILSVLKTWKFWKELLIMSIGMFVAAAAVHYVLVPSGMIVGSISGLSIVVSKIFALASVELKVSTVVLVINAFLLVLAYLLIGKEFGLKTVYTALILGPMMDLWETILPQKTLLAASGHVSWVTGEFSFMGDPWFDMLAFLLILSASQAIMFSINASTGGLDIIAKIFNKYLHFDIGVSVTVAGAIICCTAFAVNPFNVVCMGLIGTWINGLTVDYFTASLNKCKRVCIISDESEKIRGFIVDTLKRGCSLYHVQGGFSSTERIEVQSLMTQTEFSDLMAFINKNDIQAFITAGNVSEVYGRWKGRRS